MNKHCSRVKLSIPLSTWKKWHRAVDKKWQLKVKFTLKRKYLLQMGISADPDYKPTTLEQLFSLKSTFFVANTQAKSASFCPLTANFSHFQTHGSFIMNQPSFSCTIVIWHDSITKLLTPSHHSLILTCADRHNEAV